MRTMMTRLLLTILAFGFTLPFFALAQTATPMPTPRPTNTVTPTPPYMATLALTPSPQDNINIGDTIIESFSDLPTSVVYRFEGEGGQFVSILLQNQLYDTTLRLIDPSGVELITGFFNNTGTGLEIPAFRLPASGFYTLAIERLSGLSNYILRLRSPILQTIEYGQVIEAALTPTHPSRLYRFSGSLGDWVDLSLTSGEFDAHVMLLNAASIQLTGDDNNGGDLNAFIGPYRLQETGDYLIFVRSKDDLSTGAFQLRLGRAEFIPLDYGDSVEVSLSQDAPVAYYSFHAGVGDVVNIQVDSGGTLDTMLNVTDPQAFIGLADDDSGQGFDPEIGPWLLSYSGQYGIQLRPFRIGTTTGQVTLSLSVQPLASLDNGPQEIRLSPKQPAGALMFTGKAGERVQLLVRVDPVMNTFPQITISQNGQTLLMPNAQQVSAFTVDFTVPANGAVIIQVSELNTGLGVMQFSLERLA